MPKRVLMLLLLAGLCASCRQSATQLVVLVDSDYAVPGELSDLRVQVSAEDGSDPSFQDFAINGRDESMPPRFAIPLSFGVVPIGDDASRRVLVDVTGLAPGGRELVRRRARTGFLANRSLLLPIFLLRSCEGVVCPEGETCDDAVCVPDEVDPLLLRPIDPGGERDSGLALDAGPDGDDSGADAGPDSGVREDAGHDGGAPDAGPDAGSTGPRFVRHVAAVATCASGSTDIAITEAVPVGDTLVVSLVWRDASAAAVSATDSAANSYDIVERAPAANPTGATLASAITTRLESGASITVTHPAAEVVSVVVDQLSGVSATPLALVANTGRSRDVSLAITAPESGLAYALVGNHNNRTFTVTGSWTRGADHLAMCPVSFGTVDHRSFHMLVTPGMHALFGSYAMMQSWIATLLVFGPS